MTIYEQKKTMKLNGRKANLKKVDTWTDSLYRVLIPMNVLGLIS